jgi:hypothetical protein
MRSSKAWTVLIVDARGRATRRLRLPVWLPLATRGSTALLLCGLVFAGWQLQALLGLDGPRFAQLGTLPWSSARGSLFMSLASSRPGLTRGERVHRAARERAERIDLGDRRAASLLLTGVVEPAWRAEAERGQASDGTLLWPVRSGWFGRGYGSGSGGYHLAIDINADRGSDVLAAAPGVVGYAGRELRGFGNVVLIVHPGGSVTLYAHNQRNLVVAGQHVGQGEPIGLLGSTGRSMGPHVHFEMMHDGRNCDPMPLIPPGPASYRNFFTTAAPVAWRSGEPRPSAVRCKRRMVHPQHESEAEGA